MYIPRMNRINDIDVMIAFMQKNNFAIVVSSSDDVPVATHLPLTITQLDEEIILRGHFAKANTQWQQIDTQEVLVIFTGPHAYISPTHYDKHESVPTWNYVAVHAYGKPTIVTSDSHPKQMDTLLNELIESHEPSYKAQWDSLSPTYREGMKKGIVGVEIAVSRIEGKAKLSQNKTPDEQNRIGHSLLQSEASHEMQVGYVMLNHNLTN